MEGGEKRSLSHLDSQWLIPFLGNCDPIICEDHEQERITTAALTKVTVEREKRNDSSIIRRLGTAEKFPAETKFNYEDGCMKFMSTWTLLPGSVKAAAEQFLAGGGGEPEGVIVLGRWHKVDGSGGFTLYETNNLAALHLTAAKWADLLEVTTVPVIEDSEAGPNLVTAFKK